MIRTPMETNPDTALRLLLPAAWRERVARALAAAAPQWELIAVETHGATGTAADLQLVEGNDAPAVLDASRCAVIVVATVDDTTGWRDWLQAGAAEVIAPEELDAPTLGRRLAIVAERRRIDAEARHAYATDLGTGLPHRQQLVEHMSHLLALREREPAPMGVLVLRVEGFETTAARFGREAGDVLRRKVAVRLRAGLRASDVVASIGPDLFAVLLAWIDAPGDAQRVAAKLVEALQQPLRIAGQETAVAVASGVSLYPDHGKEADPLLAEALRQAAGQTALGRVGFANRVEGGRSAAANDD
jgi:diguanylate cyclase (GGDEF)-like protein